MIVILKFDFPDVEPNGSKANELMELHFDRKDLKRMQEETGAFCVYVDDVEEGRV